MMKLRVRSAVSSDTLKIEVPSNCTLQQLKQVIISNLVGGGDYSAITVSLNRKDELFGLPEEPLHSLGVASGDLLYYTTVSSARISKTRTTGPESSSGSSQRVASSSSDVGMINCGNSVVKEPKETRIEESEAERSQFEDPKMAGVETLENEEEMDVDLCQDVSAERQSIPPYFLNNLKDVVQGDPLALSGHSLLVAAVHALLVNSGFIRLDSVTGAPAAAAAAADVFQLLLDCNMPAKKLSLRYTLTELVESKDAAASEFVTVSLHKLGCTLVIHASLNGNKSRIYTLKLNEQHYASKMELLLRKSCESLDDDSGGNENLFLNALLQEKEVFEFYKEVKDRLALPLLIDICIKAGLPLPPCLMLLPTELKLMIFELVSATDLAKLACQCSELRYLTSDNSLWKMKYVEKFGSSGVGSDSTNWKHKFVSSWKIEKARKQAHEYKINVYDRLYRTHRRPRPFGTPFIIGGRYDMLPFGAAAPFGGSSNRQPSFPYPSFQPVRRFSPSCNHGGSQL